MKSLFHNVHIFWLPAICILLAPTASRAAGETYYASPAFRTYTSSNLVYKLTADTSPGSGKFITNGILRFKLHPPYQAKILVILVKTDYRQVGLNAQGEVLLARFFPVEVVRMSVAPPKAHLNSRIECWDREGEG